MRYLVDTNIFLWWLNNNRKLKLSTRRILKNSQNHIFVSVASGWEISIKHKNGKLTLKTTVKRCFELAGFEILPITLSHVLNLEDLPLYHKDPFDRILLSQAQVENLTLISSDEKMWRYKTPLLKS